MKKFVHVLMAAAYGAILSTGGAQAADIKEHTLRFAFQNVAEHPQGLGAKKFAEIVAQKSGGKMQVKLFAGGQLGGDVQTVSALQGGTIDLTVLNSGILQSQAKEFAILDLPFLFNNYKEADAVVDGKTGKQLADKLRAKGLVGLGYWDLGFRNVTNSKRPITKLEDFSGLKIRVIQSPIYIDTFSALGANPVPMPFPEVYTALEQKTVDGQENPFTTIEGNKFQEVQKYLSLTGHVYTPAYLIVGSKKWATFPADVRKILEDTAKELQSFVYATAEKDENELLAKIKAAGVQVNEADKAAFVRASKAVYEEFGNEVKGSKELIDKALALAK